jgi:hypothetical protein
MNRLLEKYPDGFDGFIERVEQYRLEPEHEIPVGNIEMSPIGVSQLTHLATDSCNT